MLRTEDELDQEMCSRYGSSCIRDGITNIEKFYNAETNYRILWILKEPNSSDEGWNMRNFHKALNKKREDKTRKDARWNWKSTYQKIVQVSHGLLHGIYHYEKIPASNEIVVDVMNSIAFINVKKTGGTEKSKWKVINQSYTDHKEFLHKQIEEISPNIIINCSGINQLFRDLSAKSNCSVINEKVDPFSYSFGNERLIINAYHPNERRLGKVKYFDVIAKIRELSGR